MKIDLYRSQLRQLSDWTPFLKSESGLPGPRGNLELAEAAAREDPLRLAPYLDLTPAEAPENTPEAFLVFSAIFGLGVCLQRGETGLLPRLRTFASDQRWRVRESVAIALQFWGDADLPGLLAEMPAWAAGNYLEQRAAVAALCEPRLLKPAETVRLVLEILDGITTGLTRAADRKDPAFQTLRQALAYGWSVAAAADFAQGKPALERWLACPDKDVRWLLRENLKKNRLVRLDPEWTASCLAGLA